MKEKNFVTEIHKDRKKFVSANKTKDHVLVSGENHVLLSAPHGVKQTRLGKQKLQKLEVSPLRYDCIKTQIHFLLQKPKTILTMPILTNIVHISMMLQNVLKKMTYNIL